MSQSTIVTTPTPDDQIQILSVRGELDLATADGLYRRGFAAIGRHAGLLLLDLADLSFCDASGLSAFVRIAARWPDRATATALCLRPSTSRVTRQGSVPRSSMGVYPIRPNASYRPRGATAARIDPKALGS